VTVYQPGETLATHPNGHRLVCYQQDNQLWSAVYTAKGIAVRHPDGGWGYHDHTTSPMTTVRLTKALLAELQQISPSGDMPPLMPDQEGLVEHLNGAGHPDASSIFVDWPAFWTAERDDDQWLYEPILAKGRGHAIFAAHKVGKSLILLYVALELARNPEPVVVIYLDYEMSRDDLEERLVDMGADSDSDLSRLRYALIPQLPALDTAEGSAALLEIVDQEQSARPDHHLLVIVDTTARAVSGEENSADTIRAFYRHTGTGLKRRGVTWARLDHAGKDPTKGQRGSSAKGDDVDIVWRVTQVDGGLRFAREASRVGWVPALVDLAKTDIPLSFTAGPRLYNEGVRPMVDLLNRLGTPINITVRQAQKVLKDNGEGFNQKLLTQAVRFRKEGLDITNLVTGNSV
jgi:hypothetical protein